MSELNNPYSYETECIKHTSWDEGFKAYQQHLASRAGLTDPCEKCEYKEDDDGCTYVGACYQRGEYAGYLKRDALAQAEIAKAKAEGAWRGKEIER